MEVSTVYPRKAKKLWHVPPGTLFQITPNDGTTDHSFYLMTNAGSSSHASVVNIRTGHLSLINKSKRAVEYSDAKIHLGDDDDN